MATRTKAELTERDAANIRRALPVTFNVMLNADGLLSKRQISALLGVSASKFRSLRVKEGYPDPDTFMGKMPRWTVASHNEWLAKRCAKERA